MGYNEYFKSKEGTMKLLDARRDHYRKLAHEQGYRSRSAFKLKELNKAYRIIGPGFLVLDLGCAPGGWTQVAVQIAGNQGKVIGVDTSYVEDIPGAELLRGNIEDESIVDEIYEYFERKVNAVICDISPNVTGNWSVDHAKQISLNYSCAKIMDQVLAYKGNALFKVFDGEFSNEFRDFLKKYTIKLNTQPKNTEKITTKSDIKNVLKTAV